MTTSKPTDIREFWIVETEHGDKVVYDTNPNVEYKETRVIQYSAYERLKAENEKLRMQLVACSTVSLANTRGTATEVRKMHPDYMCVAVSDVANAVDREIKLREQVKDYEQALKFYSNKSNWLKKDDSICIDDDDTELSDYVNQLGADEYGGKLAREVLKKWSGV